MASSFRSSSLWYRMASSAPGVNLIQLPPLRLLLSRVLKLKLDMSKAMAIPVAVADWLAIAAVLLVKDPGLDGIYT